MTGAALGPFVMVNPDRGFLVYTTDFTISSHLESFTVSGGLGELPVVYSAVDFLAETLVVDPGTNTFFFPHGGFIDTGLHVFDVVEETRLTRELIRKSGPPRDLILLTPSAGEQLVRGDATANGIPSTGTRACDSAPEMGGLDV